ncbi:MAG TPA: hypothetical protein VF666_20155 [Pyrinomonadaceae bacterium]|jgi:hypothetical protein
MSTDASNAARPETVAAAEQGAQASVPKKITNAQTVCNQKNEKGKLCNGHIKQTRTAGEPAEVHLRGDDVLFKCQSCGTLYMGPPLGHVRDPQKQSRFVEKELTALLEAAGGTLPAFKKSPTGAWIPVAEAASHAPAAAGATPKAAPAAGGAAKPAAAAKPVAPKPAAGAPRAASTGGRGIPPPPAHLAPPPNETPEEKRARLARIVAEAKAKAGKEVPPSIAAAAASAPPRTAPAANTTSGTDSSASADAHRPAAEAQAATGAASAAPLSPAAATASPNAGAETPEDLAPDTLAEATSDAPAAAATSQAAAPPVAAPPRAASTAGGKGIPPPPAHLAPPPGETHEEKIARLRRVVEEAKARAGK